MRRNYLRTAVRLALLAPASLLAYSAAAQEAADTAAADDVEVISVTGIRGSMARSMEDKKIAKNIVDTISAEDIGKFPDQNVAESLQRITGVSIDRSSGEGQFVTVRGFGPQFNTVLVNGRQLATENGGREFSFDTLASETISGAEVYKSPTASMQEGGIGATINLVTARPFDFDGFTAAGSVKGVYDDVSEKTSPQASGMVSNTFADGKAGVLLSLAYAERESQDNIIETRYYRPGVNFTAQNGKEFNNVFVPQNFDVIADLQDRTRTNANLVFQYAPTEELTLTFDGLYSKLEVDSDAHSAGHWFSDGNFIDAEVDANNTVVYIDNANTGATDFIRRTYGRDVEISAFGFNAEWLIRDDLTASFDVSTSTAEDNSGGKINFNVIGYNNAYQWDNRNGDTPTIAVEGGDDALLAADRGRAHYNERNGLDTEDTINEVKLDFNWTPDSDTFTNMNFGVYYQDRDKDIQRKFASDCNFYCGYGVDVPDELLSQFTPNGFFDGVPNTWLTYDPEAYFAFLGGAGLDILQAANPDVDVYAAYAALGMDNPPTAADQYRVQEEVLSAYMDFTFEGEVGDMPWTANFGVRYTKTDSDLGGVSRELLDLEPIPNDPSDLNEIYAPGDNGQPVDESNSYTNLLPSFNLKLEVAEDMLVRFAFSETMTRPTMDSLVPSTTVTVSRPNNNQAVGGNPNLKPYVSTNWDVSYEWYYDDASYFAAAVFSKEVEDFITNTVETEVFNLESGAYDFSVRRPRNGEIAKVDGLEVAWTHTLESGFGIMANATFVDSDAQIDFANVTESFALEGLGDSQNIVLFYEKDAWQFRVAFNNREGFLQDLVSPLGGSEPRYTETYGQWDVSGSYQINDNWNVFFEGINVTGEELRRHGRFENQFIQLIDNGTRYALGIRASF